MIAHTANQGVDTDRRTRFWVTIFVCVGILELPYLSWPWVAPLLQPKQFTNRQEQIADALRQHGVALTQVYLDQGWPDRINSQTYGANLTIYVAHNSGTTPVAGRIECRVQKRQCWFQITKLNTGRVDLPDLVTVSAAQKAVPSVLDRIRDMLTGLGVHM